jgi:hypothetical protein
MIYGGSRASAGTAPQAPPNRWRVKELGSEDINKLLSNHLEQNRA